MPAALGNNLPGRRTVEPVYISAPSAATPSCPGRLTQPRHKSVTMALAMRSILNKVRSQARRTAAIWRVAIDSTTLVFTICPAGPGPRGRCSQRESKINISSGLELDQGIGGGGSHDVQCSLLAGRALIPC